MTLEPRYPRADARAGHYESIYLVASHPGEPVAVWIRYTVHKPPDASPTASVWFTLFSPDGPHAGKITTDDLHSDATDVLAVGSYGSVRRDGAVGSINAGGTDVAWELRFEAGRTNCAICRTRGCTAPRYLGRRRRARTRRCASAAR
jgi:hypothetical protein